MALPPKTPPRFVPTLTEVVQMPPGAPLAQSPAAPPVRTTVMPSPEPLAVRPPAVAEPAAARPAALSASPPPVVRTTAARAPEPTAVLRTPAPAPVAHNPAPAVALPDGAEEYMVHRVMQRVDVVLDQRLREAIATVVQEQTRSVLPRLREEIESVVRHAVYEAVADELASGAPPAAKG